MKWIFIKSMLTEVQHIEALQNFNCKRRWLKMAVIKITKIILKSENGGRNLKNMGSIKITFGDDGRKEDIVRKIGDLLNIKDNEYI